MVRAGRQSTASRREELIDHARRIIAVQGMEELTTRALAEAAGITEGAIYRHFDSKDDILYGLIDDIEATLQQISAKAKGESQSPLETLENMLREHLSAAERRQGVSFLVIAEVLRNGNTRLRQRMRRVIDGYLARIEEVLNEGVGRGQVDPSVDPGAAAIALFGLVQATVTLWHFTMAELPLAERHDALWKVFRNGVSLK